MKKFKFISLVIAVAMIMSTFTSVFAVDFPKSEIPKNTLFETVKTHDMNEVIRVIIEIEGKPLLDYVQAKTLGADEFLATETAQIAKSKLVDAQSAIKKEILNTVNSNADFKYSYTNTLNGFAAEIQKKDISKIREISGVKEVYLDAVYDLPTPKMATSAGMVNATQTNLTYKGEGSVVAVIDTGVDVNHELMVLADATDEKLVKNNVSAAISELEAAKLVDNLSADDVYANRKFPFVFDYADKDTDAFTDGNNHGAHVSGTVAANGTVAASNGVKPPVTFDGIAPEAQILGMKVFSSKGGGAYTSDTLAAVQDAIELGADAINLSLGSIAGFTFYEDYEGIDLRPYEYEYTFKKARDAGVILAVSAGNEDRVGDGGQSLYGLAAGITNPLASNVDTGHVGSPSTKYHATSVASIENTNMLAPFIQHTDGRVMSCSDQTGFIKNFNGETLSYIECGIGKPEDFEGKVLTDKVALIQRGELDFTAKVANAQAAGAKGVVVYNSESGGNSLINMASLPGAIPAIFVGYDDGMYMITSADKSIECHIVGDFDNPDSREMSDFTSWGCTPNLKLKPEITAPGGQIYSTLQNNEYGLMSGTSMAAPHVAGGAALVQEYVREDPRNLFNGMSSETKADIIENLLMSTANTILDPDGDPYSPRRQGAGLMNIEAAVTSDVYLKNAESLKAKIELGDKIGDSFDIEFDIVNMSNNTYTYELGGSLFTEAFGEAYNEIFIVSSALNLEDSVMEYNGQRINVAGTTTSSAITGGAITGSAITVNAAPGTTHVTINVTMNSAETDFMSEYFPNGFFVEGFVELNEINSQPTLSIPFMGFYGDWTDAPIFDGSDYDDSIFFAGVRNGSLVCTSYAYSSAYDEIGNLLGYYRLGGNAEGSKVRYGWISFSPDNDGYLDDMGMKVNLLRNAKELKVDVLNADGEIVKPLLNDVYYSKTYYSANQAMLSTETLPSWDGTDKDGNLAANGQYIYRVTGLLDYAGAEYEYWNIPVSLDTQAPVIGNVDLDSVNKTVTVSATDNFNLLAATLKATIGEASDVVLVDVLDSEGTFVFDISAFEGMQATLTVEDSAGNMDTRSILIVPDVAPDPSPSPSPSPGTSTTPAAPTPETTTGPDGKVTIEVPESLIEVKKDGESAVVTLSDKVIDYIKDGKSDILKVAVDKESESSGVVFTVPKNVADALNKNSMAVELEYSGVASFIINVNKTGEIKATLKSVNDMSAKSEYSATSLNYDLNVTVDGKEYDNSDKSIKISLSAKNLADAGKAGVYTLDADGNLEYVMTYLNGDNIEFCPPHFSPYSVMIYNKTFDDIKLHWAKNAIEEMASKHIVKGKTDTEFAPEDIVTRAEFVTMVARALDLKGEAKSSFANMTGEEWYADYMSLAKDAGLIEGATYNAEGIISRNEMAKIISKAHAILNGKTVKFEGTVKFSDVPADSEYAEFIGYATENGLINGVTDKLFNPVENTTRAEAMTVIQRLINGVK